MLDLKILKEKQAQFEAEQHTEKYYDDTFSVDVIKARILAMQSDPVAQDLRKEVLKTLKNSEAVGDGLGLRLVEKIELVFSSRLKKSVVLDFNISEQELDAKLENVRYLAFVDVLYRGSVVRSCNGESLGPDFVCLATDQQFALCEIIAKSIEDYQLDPTVVSRELFSWLMDKY